MPRLAQFPRNYFEFKDKLLHALEDYETEVRMVNSNIGRVIRAEDRVKEELLQLWREFV